MIPIYDVNNLTGNLDGMFRNIMIICFKYTIILLIVWIFISLLIWLFRGQQKVWKSNKIWYKEFYNNLNINNYYINNTIIA